MDNSCPKRKANQSTGQEFAFRVFFAPSQKFFEELCSQEPSTTKPPKRAQSSQRKNPHQAAAAWSPDPWSARFATSKRTGKANIAPVNRRSPSTARRKNGTPAA